MTLAVKTYAKVDIRVFCSFQILPGFLFAKYFVQDCGSYEKNSVDVFFKKKNKLEEDKFSATNMEKTVCKVMEHSEAAKHLEIPFGIFSRKNFFKNQGTTN